MNAEISKSTLNWSLKSQLQAFQILPGIQFFSLVVIYCGLFAWFAIWEPDRPKHLSSAVKSFDFIT